jgi:hypothetical protein
MRSDNDAAIIATIKGRACDPPEPRPSCLMTKQFLLAAGPPDPPAQEFTVERRPFAAIFVKKLM